MDRRDCETMLVGRCVVLISYRHRRACWGASKAEMIEELGWGASKAEMIEELGWLAEDALRWGVRPEVVAAGVLAELRRKYDAGTADVLVEELCVGFGPARMVA